MLSKEYLAGFFDGEGSVYIVFSATDKTYRCGISISQKDPTILGWIFIQYPEGSISENKTYKNTTGSTYDFRIMSVIAIRFLNDIKDYCIIKKPQIELALEYLSKVGDSGTRLSDSERQYRVDVYNKLKEMKVYSNKQ